MSEHVNFLMKKLQRLFGKLRKVAKSKWGIHCNVFKRIYQGLFVPIVAYAAAGWLPLANEVDLRRLASVQRQALPGVTRAYRTVSTDALTVVAGVMPFKYLLLERAARYSLRKEEDFRLENSQCCAKI